MKHMVATLLLTVAVQATGQKAFFSMADAFFKVNVSREGQVNYERIKQSPSQLNSLMDHIAKADLASYDDATRKAFLINAYNLAVIKEVVDLWPIKSPLDNNKFFTGIEHNVGGQQMTLDQIEKGTLFAQYPDPRLHFVLVCAAVSCPPLAQYAYRPETLESRLEDRTRQVLNLDWFIQVNSKKVQLSQLFDWYRKDFERDGQTLIEFINQYREEKLEAKRPSFYVYDWSVNAQK